MTSFVSPNPPSPTSPSLIETDQDSKGRSPAPRSGVGESRLIGGDDEREAHIAGLNQLILECYAAYQAFGCEEDRAEAQGYGQAARCRCEGA